MQAQVAVPPSAGAHGCFATSMGASLKGVTPYDARTHWAIARIDTSSLMHLIRRALLPQFSRPWGISLSLAVYSRLTTLRWDPLPVNGLAKGPNGTTLIQSPAAPKLWANGVTLLSPLLNSHFGIPRYLLTITSLPLAWA